MNYGQFFNMMPEAVLMAVLVVVFLLDFILKNNNKKHSVLYVSTALLLVAQCVACVGTWC